MTQMYPKNGSINKLDALIIQLIHLFVCFHQSIYIIILLFSLTRIEFRRFISA